MVRIEQHTDTNKQRRKLTLIEALAKITFANGTTREQTITAAANNVHEALNFAVSDYAKREGDKLTKQGKDGRVKRIELNFLL